jgi:hypothetical protein
MKKTAVALIMLLVFASCERDNQDSMPTEPAQVTQALTVSGGWRITTFIEDGEDETRFFTPYRFEFSDNGTVTASRPGETINGTYRIFQDDGRTELAMQFPVGFGEFNELNDDWYLISRTDREMRFEDDKDVKENVLVFQR